MDRRKSRGGKSQKREEKRRSEKRKNQEKEDTGARKGRRVTIYCVSLICTPSWREANFEVTNAKKLKGSENVQMSFCAACAGDCAFCQK